MRAPRFLWVWLAAPLAAIACGEDGTVAPVPAADASGGDGSSLVAPAVLVRGEYVARTLAGCGECHTPRDALGNLDMSRWMAGVAERFDLVPSDDSVGGISAPNLTPAALASWTDDEIKRAFRDGVRRDGAALFPLMPYYAFHNMSDADADAVVAYLRGLPPIDGTVPARQPLPVAFDAPAPPLPESSIPHAALAATDAQYAAAERGRYLAGEIGFCLDCHTNWRLGPASPLDMAHAFAGGRAFSAAEWATAVGPDPTPPVVYSANVTPDATGIARWTADDVARALHDGVAREGDSLCRPMPSGPSNALGALSAEDAHDIGVYLTNLPPIDGGDIPSCR